MKTIIFGSTGMVGKGVLLECLDNNLVESILVINRQSCTITHPKLKEIIHSDMFDLSAIEQELKGYDTCFYCLGVSAAGLTEQTYHKMTYDLTIQTAELFLKLNTNFTFCYISGQGSDSTEKGNIMWARVKGKTENKLISMPFAQAYIFRPGFIQPMRGIKSKTKLYNALYAIFSPLYFILKHFDTFVTNTDTLGKAFVNVAIKGYDKKILESKDINIIGK